MNYTTLGKSNMVVSRICLGTMHFGSATSEQDAFAIMDRALEMGINFFDTANVYGGSGGRGRTEEILGRWFQQGGGRRDRVVLATKVFFPWGDGPNLGGLSRKHIVEGTHAALDRAPGLALELHRPDGQPGGRGRT